MHLAQRFLDFEPGIHFCQMQMQAGTAEFVDMRVYNPLKQATVQNPTPTPNPTPNPNPSPNLNPNPDPDPNPNPNPNPNPTPSPLKQATDQDPEGSFIRHWLPELRDVPLSFLHDPSRMPRAVQ